MRCPATGWGPLVFCLALACTQRQSISQQTALDEAPCSQATDCVEDGGSPACCSGGCTDLSEDPNNCGGCGTACTAGASPACCASGCTDVSSDSQNCGDCGQVCADQGVCTNGLCAQAQATPSCDSGEVACGGFCLDATISPPFTWDPNNCGSCGNVCQGVSPGCCFSSCVDFDSDPNNCGGCGAGCATGQSCQGSACVGAISCAGTLCDGVWCTDLTSDPGNCGSCDNLCPGLEPCVASQCCTGTVCDAGLCTDLTSDPNNCGGCGVVCGDGGSCESSSCE
jgi:Stigma-specific protein, Stig1